MGSRASTGPWTRRDIRDAARALGFVVVIGTILFVAWIYCPQNRQQSDESPEPGQVDPDAPLEQPGYQTVSLPPAPRDPIDLAAYELSSRIADEKDAHDGTQAIEQQLEHKRNELRVAVKARDDIVGQIDAARIRTGAKAQQLAVEQALLTPLQAVDRQAQREVFDLETEFKRADATVIQFTAKVTEVSEAGRKLTAERDAQQAELDYEVAALPSQLASLRQDLRLESDADLLSQSVQRAQQREERDQARESYGPLCQLYSRQSEAQRESLHASVSSKSAAAMIEARLKRTEALGLARQAALRKQLADVEEKLVIKQLDLDRQQRYLDEAWTAYDAKQAELQLARRTQASSAAALREAQEQVAARTSELFALQQGVALLQPALASAEAQVQAASAEVDDWLAELTDAREKLHQARAATRDARTTLFTEKAAAESGAGVRTTLNVSF